MPVLTDENKQFFLDNGFLVIENFLDEVQTNRLQAEAARIIDRFDSSSHRSVFTTRDQTTDERFMRSASDVTCFFEDGVFDKDGNLTVDKALAVNKIGHALHEAPGPFKEFAENESVKGILRDLGYVSPIPVQSMYILKSAKVGGVVSKHQDASFLGTAPRDTVIGFWVALDDATLENGCLWAAPGSHLARKTYKRFVRGEGGGCALVGDEMPTSETSATPLEVRRGTLVLLDGQLIHWSNENRSGTSRHAFSMHVVEGGGDVTWRSSNWLQRTPALPFHPLY